MVAEVPGRCSRFRGSAKPMASSKFSLPACVAQRRRERHLAVGLTLFKATVTLRPLRNSAGKERRYSSSGALRIWYQGGQP